MLRRTSAAIVTALVLATGGGATAELLTLADPVDMLVHGERVDFVGRTEFLVESTERGVCLRSRPNRSATGLYHSVDIPLTRLRRVTWSWLVERIHLTADIRDRAREDFAAKIAFVFGEPTWLNRDIPTLAYVWTSTKVANGSLIASTRFANLRYVHLHGSGEARTWQDESRDIAADYRSIFGSDPPSLRYVAIFSDNDQTGESTSALFGRILSLD